MSVTLKKQLYMAVSPDGECPFEKWYEKLSDKEVRATVRARILRLSLGNSGDGRSLQSGVQEAKLKHRGLRIYWMEFPEGVVLLLVGGDKRRKSHQNKDIKYAIKLAQAITKGIGEQSEEPYEQVRLLEKLRKRFLG